MPLQRIQMQTLRVTYINGGKENTAIYSDNLFNRVNMLRKVNYEKTEKMPKSKTF